MKHPPIPTARLRMVRHLVRGLLVLALILWAPSAVVRAQDADDDGVLPVHDGGDDGSQAGVEAGSVVTLDGTVVEPVLEPTRARLAFSGGQASLSLEPVGPQAEAVFQADASGVHVEVLDGAVRLQGVGSLGLPDGLAVRFEAAPAAAHRMAVLVLDDGTASLADLLAGQAAPLLVVPVGDLPSVDLVHFRAIVAAHAAALAGLRVSWVFASLDPEGEVHVAAAAASADEAPVLVHID